MPTQDTSYSFRESPNGVPQGRWECDARTPCTSIVRTPPPRYKGGHPHRNAHTDHTSYPCLGSCSSWCPIMPIVRAVAYLYELSSRRLKWSEPYPHPPLSLRRTPPATTRRWRFHCLYPGPPIFTTTYTCDELSRALLLPSHNDSVSLDNERSIDRPVILGLGPWIILMGEGRRWKSGRWVSDLAIIGDLWLLLFFFFFSYSMDRYFNFFNFCYSSYSFSFL